MLRALVVALAAAALLAPASALAAHDHGLERAVQGLVDRKGGPPGAIVIVRRGSHREVTRAGYADVRIHRRIHTTDRMRIASVAKAFSGAVVLSLIADHRLSADDPIGKWLPGLPAAWHPITVAQALQHTSGLPDFSESAGFLALLRADLHRSFAPNSLWTFVAGEPLHFTPGTGYRYSNTDNVIAALVAQAVTGRTYTSLLRERVTRPFGLRRTSLPSGWMLRAPYIHGYDVSGTRPQDISTLVSASGAWASGGIVSTPSNLERFATAYVGARIFPRSVQSRQMRWVRGSSGPPGPGTNSAGLGIFRYQTRCGTVYGHTGNFPGYTQFFAATKDRKRSVTMSVSTVLTPKSNLKLYRVLRSVQERAVCSAFGRR